ncbi:unnamed protein product [Fusarium graminearum]|uniref:Uncharacterized protein n=1 Tax=Gibberella zeae TaxID=5518 RepID=A0A4U9F733_GIBZA|nr:unnamed protein product [Fusarium graminearum]CAG1960710.1 unnamed protein product [Fusarium graminearum]CAG2009525.1 unnamed protein product [Fusarium graminearum]VTO90933.1 unnamed protein product [Fusarium graminearum]
MEQGKTRRDMGDMLLIAVINGYHGNIEEDLIPFPIGNSPDRATLESFPAFSISENVVIEDKR